MVDLSSRQCCDTAGDDRNTPDCKTTCINQLQTFSFDTWTKKQRANQPTQVHLENSHKNVGCICFTLKQLHENKEKCQLGKDYD